MIYQDIIRGSEFRRGRDKSIIEQEICLKNFLKKKRHQLENLKKNFRKITKLMKQEKNSSLKIREDFISILRSSQSKFEENYLTGYKLVNLVQNIIGNLVHNSSFRSKYKNENRIQVKKKISFFPNSKPRKNHVEILYQLKGVEYKRGQKVSGRRGYFLKGPALLLNISLIRFAIDFLSSKGFINLQPPFFMNGNLLKKCAQLEDFEEQLFFLGTEEQKYLIATSEQPISTFHSSEKIGFKELPIKYMGLSSCFRKESGSHGKDTNGIFRVHQFEKVEQFGFDNPINLNSWSLFDEFKDNAAFFYKSLKIPILKIDISSNSINNSSSKKIDILGWFPASNCFRELVSCSNCTDYQAKKLDIQMKNGNNNNRDNYVHLINSTLCATSRVICCLIENFQTSHGIIIPDCLRSYLGISFLKF